MVEINVDLKGEIIRRQHEDDFMVEETRRISEGRQSEFELGEAIPYGSKGEYVYQIFPR